MQIDWNHFTPFASLAGGGVIAFTIAMLAGMLLHDNVWTAHQRKVAPAVNHP